MNSNFSASVRICTHSKIKEGFSYLEEIVDSKKLRTKIISQSFLSKDSKGIKHLSL